MLCLQDSNFLIDFVLNSSQKVPRSKLRFELPILVGPFNELLDGFCDLLAKIFEFDQLILRVAIAELAIAKYFSFNPDKDFIGKKIKLKLDNIEGFFQNRFPNLLIMFRNVRIHDAAVNKRQYVREQHIIAENYLSEVMQEEKFDDHVANCVNCKEPSRRYGFIVLNIVSSTCSIEYFVEFYQSCRNSRIPHQRFHLVKGVRMHRQLGQNYRSAARSVIDESLDSLSAHVILLEFFIIFESLANPLLEGPPDLDPYLPVSLSVLHILMFKKSSHVLLCKNRIFD